MTSPIVINVPTRALLPGEAKRSFVRWLVNLNIKRNLTSMFVNKYLPYCNVSRSPNLMTNLHVLARRGLELRIFSLFLFEGHT